MSGRRAATAMQKLRMRQNKLFRRIEGDIKEKEKKRRSNRDLVQESYVDRDRLIAVSIGESDIRETMLKHREFLAEKNPEMHFEDEQNFRILVQQGEHELKKGAFHTALSYLDKAVKILPNDLESRLLRGCCLSGVQEYERAIEDVDAVLEEQSDCSRALHVKAEALYQMGDFEHALVFYYRALACSCSTKEENSVRFGIGRAERAIDNALGVNAATGHFAQMDGIIDRIPSEIFELSWVEIRDLDEDWDLEKAREMRNRRRAAAAAKSSWSTSSSSVPAQPSAPKAGGAPRIAKKTASIYAKQSKFFTKQDSKKDNPKTRRERAYQRRLLGNLNKDLVYLQTLASEVKLTDDGEPDQEGKKVALAAEDAISFLCKRQEFWRQFKPMYSEGAGAGGRFAGVRTEAFRMQQEKHARRISQVRV